VDSILQDFKFAEKAKVLAAYPHGLHKVDREGRPVLVYRFGAVDLDTLEKVTTQERLTLFHIQVRQNHITLYLDSSLGRTGVSSI
jgi:hypothetical protein